MDNSVIVSLRDIVVEFDGQRILDGLNLDIHDKEFVTLLGSSGCGKTTTLRLIAGFLEPNSGKVLLKGQDITGVPPYKRPVNTVFQKYALFPHLNVFENVAFGLRLKKMDEETIRRKVRNMLEVVGLKGFERRSISQMSGGQQQRVALARALAVNPRVLLLDEPLSALDAKVRVQLRDEIRRIQLEAGTTTVFVTHDQEEALAVADRNAPGIAEAMRYHSLSITPRGMLSRAASVLRGKTLIVNLPGSPKAVQENLEYILPSLEHGLRIAAGLDGECARH